MFVFMRAPLLRLTLSGLPSACELRWLYIPHSYSTFLIVSSALDSISTSGLFLDSIIFPFFFILIVVFLLLDLHFICIFHYVLDDIMLCL
ncbi:uncharacterized protein BO87DRAFT_117289 [Aspergillus neoniger CBS 115656]|uniref:Uncharacterized protein n=1 Tax=Aspergillus neoniger (strain CBS 115656) TaxID=1448310 RepID=A0A318YC65_ASPNB|nr:hypothetical protein BO87DRAFT_117289 [Aspergillus neoniger CBS 115656]PYH31995.1 hypothetical protein BO87DRAFT_117289 [Aspergillus neoniger CBS 115656]